MHADHERQQFIFENLHEVRYLGLTDAVNNADAGQFSLPITPENADMLYKNASDLMLRANNIDLSDWPYGAARMANSRMAESMKNLADQALKAALPKLPDIADEAETYLNSQQSD